MFIRERIKVVSGLFDVRYGGGVTLGIRWDVS